MTVTAHKGGPSYLDAADAAADAVVVVVAVVDTDVVMLRYSSRAQCIFPVNFHHFQHTKIYKADSLCVKSFLITYWKLICLYP